MRGAHEGGDEKGRHRCVSNKRRIMDKNHGGWVTGVNNAIVLCGRAAGVLPEIAAQLPTASRLLFWIRSGIDGNRCEA